MIRKVLRLPLLILFSILSCTEVEDIQPSIQENEVLYQYYPEFKYDSAIQNNDRMLSLLHYLANNEDVLNIRNLHQLHVVTEPVSRLNLNVRSASDELWQLIMKDSMVVIRDLIIPSSFFESIKEDDANGGRTAEVDDCDCISTATGLRLPKDLCGCDPENNSDVPGGGGSGEGNTNNGGDDSTVGFTYGSPSSVEGFFNPTRYGGGVSTGTNLNGDEMLASMLILPTSIEETLRQDPHFYDKFSRPDQLSISEALYWAGWGARLNEIQNENLYYDILNTIKDYSYLYQFGRDYYGFFEGLLRDPLTSDILDSFERSELVLLRKKVISNLKGEYIMAVINPGTIGVVLSLAMLPDVSRTFRPRLFRSIARFSSNSTGQGYTTFEAFKKAHGAAGHGKQWHHIVSQRATNVSKLGAKQIHNTNNLVKIEGGFSGSWHSRINSFYLKKNPMSPIGSINTNNLRFGEWVAQKSFAEQMEWGLKVMQWMK